MKKLFILFLLPVFMHVNVSAQDWMAQLDSASGGEAFTSATFKTTRLINLQTLETLGKRTLDFRISHRFGAINSGSYNLWGIDGPANIKLSLEYSYDGRLMAGFGRSSFEKMFDGFLKYRLYRQTDDNKHPLSVTLFASMFYTTLKDPDKLINGFDRYQFTSSRMSYVYQVIAGRKFSRKFSFQVSPYFVHYNLAEKITDENDSYGVSFATRFKFSKRSAITAEYSWRISDYS